MSTSSSGVPKLSEFPPAVLEALRAWVAHKIDAIRFDPVGPADLHKVNWAIGRRSILDEIETALVAASREQSKHNHVVSKRPPH